MARSHDWGRLSPEARKALVTGQRPYMTLRVELYDHGLIEDPDTAIMAFTDAGLDAAEYGREDIVNHHSRLLDRLLYFTECQLATVEDLNDRSRFPKGEKKRHENIADKMIDECHVQGLRREDAAASKCPRAADRLRPRE